MKHIGNFNYALWQILLYFSILFDVTNQDFYVRVIHNEKVLLQHGKLL